MSLVHQCLIDLEHRSVPSLVNYLFLTTFFLVLLKGIIVFFLNLLLSNDFKIPFFFGMVIRTLSLYFYNPAVRRQKKEKDQTEATWL